MVILFVYVYTQLIKENKHAYYLTCTAIFFPATERKKERCCSICWKKYRPPHTQCNNVSIYPYSYGQFLFFYVSMKLTTIIPI